MSNNSMPRAAQRRGVSRRGFFQAAGASIAAFAAGGLAGCGTGQTVSAPVNEATQASTGPAWLGEAPKVDETLIAEELEYDVVVVGCGTAGLPALIAAAQAGAKALGIESQDACNNVREDLGSIDSKLQKESFEQFPQFKIEKAEALEDIVRYANGFVNYDLVKLWADESGAMIDWLTELIEREGYYKMRFEGSVGTENTGARDRAWATGHSPEKVGGADDLKFGHYLAKIAGDEGAKIRYNATMVRCEQDKDGRVTGVICREDREQSYFRVKAKGGVILATGGYGNNTAMMEARQAWNQRMRINIPVGGNPTGDGIKAAMWCGASIDPVGAAVTFNRACVKPDEVTGADVKGAWFWFGEQPYLKVNLDGKRFCNESGPYDYMLHSAYLQPHHMYVDIWDSGYVEKTKQINEVGCCRLYPFDNGAPSNMPISLMAKKFVELEEAGYIQKADTIDELAKKLNIPVEATRASFERYNAFADAGRDEDYNKEPYRLIKLDQPPYYGVRTGAWFLATIDGCPVNTDMQAVTDEGKAIDGLYVCGNDSGGFFAVSYPNLFTGLAAGRSMTFGRRAGTLAAERAKKA